MCSFHELYHGYRGCKEFKLGDVTLLCYIRSCYNERTRGAFMHRFFFSLALFIITASILFANGEQDYVNFNDRYVYTGHRDELYSIPGLLSGGLLTNEMDAAFNADETSSGPGFSDLDYPYLFGGVDNLANIANDGMSNRFFMGTFIPGNISFSFYAKMYHDGYSQQILEEEDPVGSGTILHDIKYYEEIADQFQFLFNSGKITTGIFYYLHLADNRDPADNYRIRSLVPSEINVVKDMNGQLRAHKFLLPLFLKNPGIQHYFELGFSFATVDSSLRNDLEQTDYADSARYFISELRYKLNASLFSDLNERNQMSLSIFAQPAIADFVENGTIGGVMQAEISERQFNIDVSVELGQSFYVEPDDAILLAFNPKLEGHFAARPILLSDNLDGTFNWGGLFSCQTVLEFKLESFFVGFSLGVRPEIGYNWSFSEIHEPDSVTTYYTSDLHTEVSHSYSIFFPLPGGYRLDASVGAQGLWDFDDLRLQLIVPLSSKK